jgi:hypothetical protein
MNKAVLGFICVFFAVASAQTDCIQTFEASLPQLQKMYVDMMAKDWIAFEAEFEKFIPTVKLLLATCANYNISDSPRVQACITDGETIARLVAPVVMNPEDATSLYILMFELPGALSSFYGQCVDPVEIKSDHDYVTVLLEQKARERDIFNCMSSLIAVLPTIKKLAADLIAKADIRIIYNDFYLLNDQLLKVCDTCNIPKESCEIDWPVQLLKATDMDKCMTRLTNIYQIVESIVNANYDMAKIMSGIRALVILLPVTLSDCGIEFKK